MSRVPFPPKLEWPRLTWKPEFWLSVVPGILGITIFLFPQIGRDQLGETRVFIGGLCFLVLLIPVFRWLHRVLQTSKSRLTTYSDLWRFAENLNSDLTQVQRSIVSLLQTARVTFEVDRAAFTEGEVFVVCKNGSLSKIPVGESIIVVHTLKEKPIGIFKITEVRDHEFYAKGISGIDTIWAGEIAERKDATVVPYLVAFPYERGK